MFSSFKKVNIGLIFFRQLANPLLLIFFISTIVSFSIGQRTESYAIWTIMFISVFMGFWNEFQAEKAVYDLIKKISYTATVIRNNIKIIIPVKDIHLGDTVVLFQGSIVPADIKLTTIHTLEINEAILTGESLPVTKNVGDMCFMGTVIASGSGEGIVTATGKDTKFGGIEKAIEHIRPMTEFQKGLQRFSLMLTKIAVIMVILIILCNWLLGHPMAETILFALTVAMGVAPELLPIIVSISLSYGARRMAKMSIIVKQLISIEDLGNMDVLCMDKTGTLTEGAITLQSYENVKGKKDDRILDFALLCNSAVVHTKVHGDAIDSAIWNYAQKQKYSPSSSYNKIFESPFNYESRFMKVVVKTPDAYKLILKGSPEQILNECTLSDSEKKQFLVHVRTNNLEGLRVICIASKTITKSDHFDHIKTSGCTFDGFITLSDVPKSDTDEAFTHFAHLGIKTKILTGDNELVTQKICREVGFTFSETLLGPDIEKMNDTELSERAWSTDIFARVTPSQKARIVHALKFGNHTVGFLGDGVNDGPALRSADVGISVNGAVDVAKDAASIVLLRKHLTVITKGVIEGRTTFMNTIKYILMVTSSSFGNMASASVASLVLPFLPMQPTQILLTDILYDLSQFAIPTDRVDKEELLRPNHWDIEYIKNFMLFFGPISSLYDFLTFGILYLLFQARGSMFQTGWFIESLVTEVLVVFVIRTHIVPFYKSRPSTPLIITCLLVILTGIALPYSPLKTYLGFTPLPPLYFLILIALTSTYLLLVETGKKYLNARHALH